MPPVNVKKDDGPQAIRKDVDFVAKDDQEQTATGIVMVPDKVDLQGDFVREDQIREFAEQFENFESVGEAGGGIMHAVFPDEWLDLERNEVLEESETIGGEQAPAGAWVQSWQYNHDDLWQLVEDGTFAGYSVGIDAVRWDGPYEQDDVEDVDVPPEIDEDALVWQIVEGIMREVSTVDIPAVPDAQILDKADEKALRDHLGNRDAFIAEAMDRGHSEAKAEEMWQVLNEAAEIEGAGEPGKESMLAKAGKAFLSALTGGDDADRTVTETPPASPRKEDDDGDDDEEEDEEDEEDEGEEESNGKHAPDGEPSDEDSPSGESTDMSKDNPNTENGGEGEKSLAEQNAEQISELTDSVKELTDAITGPEPETAEIELDGNTYEVRADAAKAVLGVGENEDVADAIQRLNEKAERVDEVEERLDTIVEQSGAGSTQLRAAANGEEEEEGSALDEIGKALS